jgi:hypothetical protein
MAIGFAANGFLAWTLDDIRLYRGVRDAAQVQQLYKVRGK